MTSRLAEFVQSHGRALVLVILSVAVAGAAMIPSIPVSIFPETNFPELSSWSTTESHLSIFRC